MTIQKNIYILLGTLIQYNECGVEPHRTDVIDDIHIKNFCIHTHSAAVIACYSMLLYTYRTDSLAK